MKYELLSPVQQHQLVSVVDRVFAFGSDGRDLGRLLLAEIGKGAEGNYPKMREEILSLIREGFDRHYLAKPPKMNR